MTAGALLAQKGLSVAVFEKQPRPGGYCASFSRKGYTFDSCIDAVSGWGEDGWLRRILGRIGVLDRVEMIRLDPLRVDLFGDERVEIPADMRELTELLCGISPGEKDGILGLIRAMEDIYSKAMATRPELLYGEERAGKRASALGKYKVLSYARMLDDFVKDEKVRAVMCDRCAFMGLPPSKVSAVSTSVMFMTYTVGGGYRVKGGAQNLADALADGFKMHGGELFQGIPVESISASGGRANGVMAGGNRVGARAVISAADASETYRMAGLGGAVQDAKPSVSFLIVYLGLGKELKIPDSMGCYPGYDIEKTFSDISSDIASPNASLEIINYSGVSPGMAPHGCSSIMLMSKAAYKYGDGWNNCKHKEMDRLIRLAGRVLPGLEQDISFAEAATPMTLKRYTGNSGGAAFGWEQSVVNRRTAVSSPVSGLFHAGHWTYPGGGIESVAASGMIAAEEVLNYLEGAH